MTAQLPQYTLVGFDACLDWRPLVFVEPIPENKLCHVCGLVCKKTALLPCRHLLCVSCYTQCTEGLAIACPLDGGTFGDRDVDWKETPADEILRREVMCWNKESGCTAVIAASEISLHYQHDCQCHSLSCPRCTNTVFCKDICTHRKSDYASCVTPVRSDEENSFSFNDQTTSSPLNSSFGAHPCQMRTNPGTLPIDTDIRDDRFVEICNSLNALKETLKQELGAIMQCVRQQQEHVRPNEATSGVTETLIGLTRLIKSSQVGLQLSVGEILASIADVKADLTGQGSQTVNLPYAPTALRNSVEDELASAIEHNAGQVTDRAGVESFAYGETENRLNAYRFNTSPNLTEKLLRTIEMHVDECVFFLKGVQSLKQAAIENGCSCYIHEKVYLRGYSVTPGVMFERERDNVRICAVMDLHKGDLDDYLVWPIPMRIELSIMHTMKNTVRHSVHVPYSSRVFQRPAGSSVRVNWFPANPVKLRDLVRDGYVSSDRLLLKWRLRR